MVNYAAANGLSVYASIGSTPGWANGKKGRNYPANNVADWKNFVTRTVARYKNQVKYWGIWNEPNLKDFFALGKDIFVQQVLLPAAQAIRAADPAAFIVGPDLSHKTDPGTEWYFWMKYILDNAGSYFDIISHHIYEDLGVYFHVRAAGTGRQVHPGGQNDRRGVGTGRQAFLDHGDRLEHKHNSRKPCRPTATWTCCTPAPARTTRKKCSFMRSSTIPGPASGPFGILRSNLEAKPAYDAYRDYIAGLYPDPGNPDEGKINKKCYVEQTAGNGAPVEQNPSLQTMFRSRDFLRGYSAAASDTVDIYYQWNEEFQEIALADSRVFNLGREILERATGAAGRRQLARHGPAPAPRPVPRRQGPGRHHQERLCGIVPRSPGRCWPTKNLAVDRAMPPRTTCWNFI